MAVDLSIVVPARGHAPELRACLHSLLLQQTSANYEVILAYCELDHEVDEVARSFPSIRSFKSQGFLLPGAARNLGAQHAQSGLIGFVDADCIVHPGWISSALRTILEGAVLCSGPILDVLPCHMLAASDNRLQFVDFAKGRPYGTSNYFPAAHLAIKREVFESLGGFPENEKFAQDVLFTELVVKQWPQKVIFNPMMKVSHYGRRDWKEFLDHHWHFGFSRAKNGIQINKTMMWIAKRPYFGWILLLRRFVYISLRVVQWNLLDLPRYILQLPFVFIGLTAWVNGFYDGMRHQNP